MNRLGTIVVVCMIVLAGCSGATGNGETNGEGDVELESENGVQNITTYINESGSMTTMLEANHDTETYNLTLENTFTAPYGEYERKSAIRIYCGYLEKNVYDETADEENESTFTKISPSGETETVRGVPDRIFEDYEPNKVKATTYAENGSVLASCTVNGEGDITYSD